MKTVRNTEYLEGTREFFWDLDAEDRRMERVAAETQVSSETECKILSLETLKGLVFYVPGTILLGLIGVIASVIFADIVVFRRPSDSLPETLFQQLAMLSIVGTISAIMIWWGIGSLKNRKHAFLPLSIFASGVIFGSIGLVLEAILGSRGDFIEFFTDHNLILYILPVLLIVPVAIREWAKSKTENI